MKNEIEFFRLHHRKINNNSATRRTNATNAGHQFTLNSVDSMIFIEEY